MQMNFCMFIRKLKSVITVLFCLSVSLMGAKIKPNIIFIFIDDQGYYDLGCYGASEVKTPRIDAMAKAGTRFTDYYAAAPICSPSRAGLLTGCYPRRVGNHIWVHRADSRSGINPDELTIAELLKDGRLRYRLHWQMASWISRSHSCRTIRGSITISGSCTILIRLRSSISRTRVACPCCEMARSSNARPILLN